MAETVVEARPRARERKMEKRMWLGGAPCAVRVTPFRPCAGRLVNPVRGSTRAAAHERTGARRCLRWRRWAARKGAAPRSAGRRTGVGHEDALAAANRKVADSGWLMPTAQRDHSRFLPGHRSRAVRAATFLSTERQPSPTTPSIDTNHRGSRTCPGKRGNHEP
jgi:hypothetical protein